QNYIALRLPHMIWKALVNAEITADDVRSIDVLSFKILDDIAKMSKQKVAPETFNKGPSRPPQLLPACHTIHVCRGGRDALCLVSVSVCAVMRDIPFTVHGSDAKQYELVPGGKGLRVSYDNKEQFCRALEAYRLHEFREQCEAIRRGLATVVPWRLLP